MGGGSGGDCGYVERGEGRDRGEFGVFESHGEKAKERDRHYHRQGRQR